ncbi:hypothetical protein BU23DRAFT_555205 [Bimuria novae-zelandiae CBS 107.79]|uniref:Uncharacterized protein n=1 Tax=Bimuria novae-zelandiae CBS 107.79 TaxID=1447943 RepID=A0A6A5VBK8_9PLEO|nr:hypothetical protein BU23DRAFT_555205 [Bimuria novae-zelandiae CBS 107.79]
MIWSEDPMFHVAFISRAGALTRWTSFSPDRPHRITEINAVVSHKLALHKNPAVQPRNATSRGVPSCNQQAAKDAQDRGRSTTPVSSLLYAAVLQELPSPLSLSMYLVKGLKSPMVIPIKYLLHEYRWLMWLVSRSPYRNVLGQAFRFTPLYQGPEKFVRLESLRIDPIWPA